MMSDVHLEYVNAAHVRIRSDPGILMELSEHFTYFKENYKFHPKYKARVWDGKIRLINRLTGICYAGLAQRIQQFCKNNDYTFSFDEQLFYDNVSVKEVNDHLDTLNLPEWLDRREYQIEALVKCLRSRRRTLISPTSSGKSFMIYALATWYKRKTLIIVPNVGLVAQFKSDIESYGFKGVIDTSMGGLLKDNDIPADIVISTWQSLDNGKRSMPKQWFNQFGVVFGDEAHGAKADTLIKILTSMENTHYRFGTTGTLDDNNLNRATIEGLFGPQYKSTTTKTLMEQGYVTPLKIKCIVLKYPEQVRKEFHQRDPNTKKKKTYPEEVDFLVDYAPRNNFIKNLTLSLDGNKLVFFKKIEHGNSITATITAAATDNDKVFYIDGSVKGSQREEIRKAIEDEERAILIASLGTTSTGVSINKLHHMIAAAPQKSKIKVLQSIGRMLRQHDTKQEAVLYDIVDDIQYGSTKNFTLQHFEERAKIYDQEHFDYKIYNVSLK